MLRGIIPKPTETGIPMEGNKRGKKIGNESLKSTIRSTHYYRSEITEECEIFQLFESHNNNLSNMYT